MICPRCAEAADLSPASVSYEHEKVRLHNACSAPNTCPCHHRMTTSAISTWLEAVNRVNDVIRVDS
jgi:hypothetical protein